jgi:hypothetical protein
MMVFKNKLKREKSELIFSKVIGQDQSIRVRLGKDFVHINYKVDGFTRRELYPIIRGEYSFQTRRVPKGMGWGTLAHNYIVRVRISNANDVKIKVLHSEFVSDKAKEAFRTNLLAEIKLGGEELDGYSERSKKVVQVKKTRRRTNNYGTRNNRS